MSRRAALAVHLVGHSVFDDPHDAESDPILPGVYGKNTLDGPSAVSGMIQVIPEFAGRACYQSFERPGPRTKTNRDYLANILRQRHFSVLEHSSVSFYVTGVSRSLTHELVRHRHFSPSQLSQRYVPVDSMLVVVPVMVEHAIKRRSERIMGPIGKEDPEKLKEYIDARLDEWADDAWDQAVMNYRRTEALILEEFPALGKKQVREAAREELPNFMETRLVITGNFRTWMEFLTKRDHEAADMQIQRFAREIGEQLAGIAPNVFGEEARTLWDPSKSQEAPK